MEAASSTATERPGMTFNQETARSIDRQWTEANLHMLLPLYQAMVVELQVGQGNLSVRHDGAVASESATD